MKRTASVRAAVAKSREARLRRVETRLTRHLRFLKRRDPDAYAAYVACLRRVVERTSPSVAPRRSTLRV